MLADVNVLPGEKAPQEFERVPSWGTLLDRDKAFQVFRQGQSSAATQAALLENRTLLREKLLEAKRLSEQVCSSISSFLHQGHRHLSQGLHFLRFHLHCSDVLDI